MNYRLLELTTSIQGELPNFGAPCVIIRFDGCNLSCSYCDAPTTGATDYTIEQIMNYVHNSKLNEVLITGGEPTLHTPQLSLLLEELADYITVVETNGTILFPPSLQWATSIAMDVKLDRQVDSTLVKNFNQLTTGDVCKFVFWDNDSFSRALAFLEGVSTEALCVFSPTKECYDDGGHYAKRMIAFQAAHPKIECRMQIQLHKILGVA